MFRLALNWGQLILKAESWLINVTCKQQRWIPLARLCMVAVLLCYPRDRIREQVWREVSTNNVLSCDIWWGSSKKYSVQVFFFLTKWYYSVIWTSYKDADVTLGMLSIWSSVISINVNWGWGRVSCHWLNCYLSLVRVQSLQCSCQTWIFQGGFPFVL